MADEPTGSLQTRLGAERDAAYRRYNEALSDLDRARQAAPDWPTAPARYDEHALPAVNDTWDILAEGPGAKPRGWRQHWANVVWAFIEPVFARQRAFNSALVDHLNRNAVAHRDANDALARALPAVEDSILGLAQFELLLMHLMQQVTPLLDTRERAIRESVEELRSVAEIAQRAAAMAKREIERVSAASPASARPAVPAPASTQPGASPSPSPPDSPRQAPVATHAYKYVGFEDRFRGSEQEIRHRLSDYVAAFAGASDVLDVGCGRGEFLDLLREAGVRSRGLDLNSEMVEACRARGLEATTGDALAYLTALPDESLGGLLAVQVVEHLDPDYLTRLLQTAFYKLRPGSRLVLETINPACWVAFFESYLRDLTHVRPIHPDTLQYLLHASGFGQAEIVYRSPIAEDAKLERVTPRTQHFGEAAADPLTELSGAFNRNMDRLNARMFTFQDYAVIARRP